ncbi:type VI secretion system tube protein Hcp [Thalassomonas viridans]|uniref:Type VI secretion system tube protein Hcp n=1 Tax=Thalassomonas viridans TaxID=137584 RepID=A0AAE9Z663_9GAMM|nr:type VI secretion system tube protein Hcp [Thalassomonas viridans]WDE06755.1 type VI secretion system tube protein Hcp [Thalassomonas viridans]
MVTTVLKNADGAAYLKLGDIEGESVDREHKDWIIIESMSSPLFRAQASTDSSGQCQLELSGRDEPGLGDVVIVRELDKSSVKLQEASCGGTAAHFDEAVIDLVSSKRRGRQPYLRYKLTNVIVTSYSISPGTNSAGDTVPMESFSLNFEAIEFEYVPSRSK